jgi:predicted nucleotidyltransferase
MAKGSIEAIIRALNEAGVNYLVVGGLAVVAHGYVRFTADVDLILDLREDNLRHALAALASLGYRPRAPVPMEQFISPDTRAQWVREKGLTVFSLFSTEHEATELDLFVEAPLDFDKAYAATARMEVAPQLAATFVSLEDLLFLKKLAGRPKDLEDIERLQALRRRPTNE